MPEMKNHFRKGRMNKDLDERLVPEGEYRDALNVEISTSDGSDIGALQTLKGNSLIGQWWLESENFVCVGSIADAKNDKIYYLLNGRNKDLIIEFDPANNAIIPVCVDLYPGTWPRALNFQENFPITGLNIMDDMLFWTDNNSEPKRIHISRGKEGSIGGWNTHTNLMVRDVALGAPPPSYSPNTYIPHIDPITGANTLIQEEHLTIIKKGPPGSPVLEMIDTLVVDVDGDGRIGGDEIRRSVSNAAGLNWLMPVGDPLEGELSNGTITINVGSIGGTSNPGVDFSPGSFIIVYNNEDRTINVRLQITTVTNNNSFTCTVLSGSKEIQGEEDLSVELEQTFSLFQFKFPRFAYRYKYEDGEYSQFSPFTQPAFLPGQFNYMPKEGYNLGMVNRLKKLIIKDFVHHRWIPEEVIAIDILYKESNSPNVYSIKTVKRRGFDPNKWDEWNGISTSQVIAGEYGLMQHGGEGWVERTSGFIPINTEMIHAVLPSNQLLRPWDNVPRKALSQEIIGNRLVYGNYLQNYDLKNASTNESNIKVDLYLSVWSDELQNISPEEIHAGLRKAWSYNPAKSVKSLRTYQIGIVYLDAYGRETPVFSEDKRGQVLGGDVTTQSSVYIDKDKAPMRSMLGVVTKSTPPEWATHYKYFVKETSNEYYNLAMDRWYEAEDGNVWLSFASAERNKVDEETFITLKKQHDSNVFVTEPARYKIIAIENEAPRFIKLRNISMGSITDGTSTVGGVRILGMGSTGFPLVGLFEIYIDAETFIDAGWDQTLINQPISQVYFRVRSNVGISLRYRLTQVSYEPAGLGYYVLRSGEQFGPDMSHTSPTGNWGNALQNCEVIVEKRTPEDRAEFEGRFFVKVKKDGTLIKNLNIQPPNLTPNWVPVKSMQVQYISPNDANGWSAANWNGFGTNRWRISGDQRTNLFALTPSASGNSGNPAMGNNTMLSGHGQQFWSMAGDDSGQVNSFSSGWFIDEVEAFRPYRRRYGGKSLGTTHNPDKPSDFPMTSTCQTWFTSYEQQWIGGTAGSHPTTQNIRGLNAYGQTPTTYLSGWGGVGWFNRQDGMATAADGDGGNIIAPVGIDQTTNYIHLSYSGLNTTQNITSNWGSLDFDWTDPSHVTDQEFIEELITPGTLWRWREDPDQVVYVTSPVGTNSGGNFTTNQFNRDQQDLDNNPGVRLFNFGIWADYMEQCHHEYEINHYGVITGNLLDSNIDCKWDFASRNIGYHKNDYNLSTWATIYVIEFPISWAIVNTACSIWPTLSSWAGSLWGCNHNSVNGAHSWGSATSWGAHYMFPQHALQVDQTNKRRRFSFHAVSNDDPTIGLGMTPPHFYLPTNNPNNFPHFDVNFDPITAHPVTGTDFDAMGAAGFAPGIRTDGVYTGYDDGVGTYNYPFVEADGVTATVSAIPQYRRFDNNNNSPARNIPGSVTWDIVEDFTPEELNEASTNPAIWETEPKEDVGLDIYHEVGQIYPIYLNDDTIEQFVGAIHNDLNKNTYVRSGAQSGGNGGNWIDLDTGAINPLNADDIVGIDVRVAGAYSNFVSLASIDGTTLDATNGSHTAPAVGDVVVFFRADGSTTEAVVGSATHQDFIMPFITWFELVGWSTSTGVSNMYSRIPFFNCYSFGNGVESDRIRDDFNQVTIDNGPKVSMTLEEPYLEERRKNGFIWSGLYNSTSGINSLNQFIQAEKITKDVNPLYGSIQKLHARDGDLVAFCEDRVLKVMANRDALYNADGNPQLISTDRVLGNVVPLKGEFGISKNPESFTTDSYRSYFADTSRGAVLRLSQDGLTPISNAGMKDWFSDNLPPFAKSFRKIIGSFDSNREEYNLTLKRARKSDPGSEYTLSFSERAKGWISFKSFIQESGISLNNTYYTWSNGNMWEHHTNNIRNRFYGNTFDSSVDVLLNQAPSTIKSFSTLNYEGSQARVTQDIINNPDYYDNLPKDGWYVDSVTSNVQELGQLEFWDKEDKWFSQIKGVKTEWLNDGTAGNIDPREFSYQGIGDAGQVLCPNCPPPNTWDCVPGTPPTSVNTTVSSCGTTEFIEWSKTNPTGDIIDIANYISQWSNGYSAVNTDTLSWCLEDPVAVAACGSATAPTYKCSGEFGQSTLSGTLIAPWTCFDPGNGSGQFSSFANCQAACVSGVLPSWECNGRGSIGLLDGTIIPAWTCYDPGDGSGTWPNYSACVNSPCEDENTGEIGLNRNLRETYISNELAELPTTPESQGGLNGTLTSLTPVTPITSGGGGGSCRSGCSFNIVLSPGNLGLEPASGNGVNDGKIRAKVWPDYNNCPPQAFNNYTFTWTEFDDLNVATGNVQTNNSLGNPTLFATHVGFSSLGDFQTMVGSAGCCGAIGGYSYRLCAFPNNDPSCEQCETWTVPVTTSSTTIINSPSPTNDCCFCNEDEFGQYSGVLYTNLRWSVIGGATDYPNLNISGVNCWVDFLTLALQQEPTLANEGITISSTYSQFCSIAKLTVTVDYDQCECTDITTWVPGTPCVCTNVGPVLGVYPDEATCLASSCCNTPTNCCDDPSASNYYAPCTTSCADIIIGDYSTMWTSGGGVAWDNVTAYMGNYSINSTANGTWFIPTTVVLHNGDIWIARHPSILIPIGEEPGNPTATSANLILYPYWVKASTLYNQGILNLNECCEYPNCNDPAHRTWNPYANISDSNCKLITYGCTDLLANNYSPAAMIDDGSCLYSGPISGCTDSLATNYNLNATIDDGSCIYPPIPGCTDPLANNYNPLATVDDGSCTYDAVVYGCMDPLATNYNINANSPCVPLTPIAGICPCEYNIPIPGCGAWNTLALNNDCATALNPNSVNPCFDGVTVDDGSCLYCVDGCTDNTTGTNPDINGSYGASTGYYACNYNPLATCDDGSCLYPDETGMCELVGCVDICASNYDPLATVDDGSCIGTANATDTNPECWVLWDGSNNTPFTENFNAPNYQLTGGNTYPYCWYFFSNNGNNYYDGNAWPPQTYFDDWAGTLFGGVGNGPAAQSWFRPDLPNAGSIVFGPKDDFLFTPCMEFATGLTYQVTWEHRVCDTTKPEMMSVNLYSDTLGNLASATYSGNPHIFTSITNTTMTSNTFTFTPAANGNYHIGFHTTTPVQCTPQQSTLCCLVIDDVEIKKV